MSRTRVLYILGWGRSGSTVLGNILGEIDGFFSAGELHYLWERSLVEGRACGCGRDVRTCEVWSEVLARIGVGTSVDADVVVAWLREVLRIRATPRLLRQRPGATLEPPALASYAALTDRLYDAVAEVTGARVVVDSSKIPADAALLRLLPGVDASYVQLVRDPRAVAYSWSRAKEQRDPRAPATMRTHGPLDSGVNWSMWNLAAEALAREVGPDRFLRVRYEDLIDDPRETVRRIVTMAREPDAELPFVDDRTVRLGANHTVSGNPDRFTTGPVSLRSDDRWRGAQRRIDRWETVALTAPLMLRYGYPLRAPSASR